MKLAKNLFDTTIKTKTYVPTEEEQTKISFVKERFQDMDSKRSTVERNWDIYQTMFEAIFTPYPDERSSSVVPLVSSLVELYVADAVKLKTKWNFKAETKKYNSQAQALEYVWKYAWRKWKIEKELLLNEYVCSVFWFSVLYTWFSSITRKQKDFTISDDLEYQFEEKEITTNNIFVKNFDIRNFWMDDQIKDNFDDAVDCIAVEYITYDKFKQYKNNKLYKNINTLEPVKYDNDYKTFVVKEEESKQGKFVKLMHYWNVERDIYLVIANDRVIIREHPIISTMNGQKALPFVPRTFWYKIFSMYGRGFWEAWMMFNTELNDLREMLMDAIRRSNSQVLALWNGLTFDGRSFSYENEILTFDWQLAWNFEQISGNPPNQAIFGYVDRIYKDIAMYMGIDVQNILWEPQQTAFQTEVQREASQKRVNIWLMNRDFAYERLADLYKDLLQTYFPIKTVEWIYPEVEIEWGEFRKGKFRKKKGKSVFEVTPETIRWDIQIDVYTNTTAPTINVVDRQQKIELLNSIANVTQWYMAAQQAWVDMEKILPIEWTLRDLAKDYNLNPVDRTWAEVDDKIKELRGELESFRPTKTAWWALPEWEALPPKEWLWV